MPGALLLGEGHPGRSVPPALLALLLTAVLPGAACRRIANRAVDSSPAAPTAGAAARDVVLITIDTLRFDALGFDGNPRPTSPNLDRFAAEGRVFPFAHAHNVMTLPSHANILTGLYPYQHGVRDNVGFRLDAGTDTAATRFAAEHFATGAFVSAFTLDARYGLSRGFDVYGEIYPQTHEPEELEVPEGHAPETVSAAVAWFAGNAGRRRFLWVHVYDPHAPYDPPEPWRTRFADDPYLGEVAFTDSALAPLLDAVRASRPAPLLVVTADHGEARGDHGELTHGLFSYEATLHVPLLVWSPGLVTPGRDERLARHIDILPTMLVVAGLRPKDRLAGASLLGPAPSEDEGASYFESLSASLNRGWAPLKGMIMGRKKYIDLPQQELYDLQSDVGERHNLASAAPADLLVLRRRLDQLPAGSMQSRPVSSEEAEKLRDLGYLSGGGSRALRGNAGDPKKLIDVDNQLQQITFLSQTGHPAEALAVARRVVSENPSMSAGYQQLAVLLRQSGDLSEAARVLQRADANGIRDDGLDRLHAIVLCDAGKPNDAVALLQRHASGAETETLDTLGIALSEAGRGPEALEAFRRAIASDPRDVLSYQNLSVALLKLGRPEEARQNLEKALAISNRNPLAWNTLGVAWMRLGQPRQALDAWRRALSEDPRQYDALYNIGILEQKLGDRAQAREALARFMATAPPSRFAAKLRNSRSILQELGKR